MPDDPYRPPPAASLAELEPAQNPVLSAPPSPANRWKGYLVVSAVSLVVAAAAGALWQFGPAASSDVVQIEQLVGALGAAIALSMFVVGLIFRNQEPGREAKVEIEPPTPAHHVEAERSWLASLPFAIDGYFEALSAKPESECNLLIELRFSSDRPPPDQSTMLELLGLVDTDASIEKVSAWREGGALVFRSGPISGGTNTRVNGVWVYSNRKIAQYVHDLVDRVLLPLQRSHPLTRVALTR